MHLSIQDNKAPMPPPTPGVPPVEHHPYNDDWGTTLVAILLMSLIVFVVLGVLIKKSFQLVPTGVLALRTIVGGGSEGYHRLEDVSENEQAGVQEGILQTHTVSQRPSTEDSAIAQDSQRRTEILSDSDFENDEVNNDDAQVLRIDRTDGH